MIPDDLHYLDCVPSTDLLWRQHAIKTSTCLGVPSALCETCSYWSTVHHVSYGYLLVLWVLCLITHVIVKRAIQIDHDLNDSKNRGKIQEDISQKKKKDIKWLYVYTECSVSEAIREINIKDTLDITLPN